MISGKWRRLNLTLVVQYYHAVAEVWLFEFHLAATRLDDTSSSTSTAFQNVWDSSGVSSPQGPRLLRSQLPTDSSIGFTMPGGEVFKIELKASRSELVRVHEVSVMLR